VWSGVRAAAAELLPTNADELAVFTVTVCFGYTLACYAVGGTKWLVGRKWPSVTAKPIDYVTKIFDAITFTSSALAIASIFNKEIIPLLGDLRMFLIIAGMCGCFYSVTALFKT
jgi:hypothetical protein